MNDAVTWATIALAVVAGLAFAVNVWQAFQTRKTIEAATVATVAAGRQAKASEAVAEASVRQAAASEKLAEEAQRNREIEWQPLLNYADNRLWNTGRGHAYRTVLAIHSGGTGIAVTAPVPVGATSSNDLGKWIVHAVVSGGVLPDNAVWALFCEDQFDNKYRFLDKGARPEVCKPDDEQSVVPWLQVWRLADPPTVPET